MNIRLSLLVCLCFMTRAFTSAVAVGTTPTLPLLKASYESNLQAIVHIDATAECIAAYGKKLDAMAEALKKSGDLEGLVAVRNERKLLDTEKSIPAESGPDVTPAVAGARKECQQAILKADIDKNRKILALADSYTTNLEQLKKQLTQQDRIDDAMLVKNEIDRLRASAEVTSAQFVIADHTSKLPQPVAQPKPPVVEPVVAPVAPPAAVPETTGTPKSIKYQRRVDSDGGNGNGWTKTTLSIKKGDVVSISTKGTWKCTGLDSTCGADGYPGVGVGVATKSTPVVVRGGGRHGNAPRVEQRIQEIPYGHNRHLQKEPYGALVYRIGESGDIKLAGDSVTFTSDEDGLLFLDSNVAPGRGPRSGCSGSIAITVEVTRKSP